MTVHSAAALPPKGYRKGSGYCTSYAGGIASSYKFKDVYACEGATTGSTSFDNPGPGVYAWQCVELVARYMWAVDGIWAGPGTGIADGAHLVSVVHAENPGIPVGLPGPGSVPAAGDVISLGPGGGSDPSSGHTAVVVSADPAKGRFTIMSQNAPDGTAGEQILLVDLSGAHNGEVLFFGAWTSASWLEIQNSTNSTTWGTAQEVPGVPALNAGGFARVTSLSCGSAGNCGAGGVYVDGSGHQQAFVVNEVNGTWSNAVEVPGTGPLNTDGNSWVNSLSCVSAGNCGAAGFYTDGSNHQQAFVVNEVNGTWINAVEVPGIGTLNVGGFADVTSVSCGSPRNCSAGGDYAESPTRGQAFVVNEVNGTWANAVEVPGTGTLNAGGAASMNSLSCVSAGNCGAAGFYTDGSGHQQAFVVNEANGTWANAIEVPGSGALNAGGNATAYSVSCGSAGNCGAAGFYADGSGSGHLQAFVVDEVNGTWTNAIEVPGSGTLNAGGQALAFSVSCGSAGNCSAGGSYTDGSGHLQAFVVNES